MRATLRHIYLCRKANMSWRTCVVVKQIQSNPILQCFRMYRVYIPSRGGSGFVTGCPCGVWCRGLLICPQHVGPLLGEHILNEMVCNFDIVENSFLYIDTCTTPVSYFVLYYIHLSKYIVLIYSINTVLILSNSISIENWRSTQTLN